MVSSTPVDQAQNLQLAEENKQKTLALIKQFDQLSESVGLTEAKADRLMEALKKRPDFENIKSTAATLAAQEMDESSFQMATMPVEKFAQLLPNFSLKEPTGEVLVPHLTTSSKRSKIHI